MKNAEYVAKYIIIIYDIHHHYFIVKIIVL